MGIICWLNPALVLLDPGHVLVLESDMVPATWSMPCLVWGLAVASGQATYPRPYPLSSPLPPQAWRQGGPVEPLVSAATPALHHSHPLAFNKGGRNLDVLWSLFSSGRSGTLLPTGSSAAG